MSSLFPNELQLQLKDESRWYQNNIFSIRKYATFLKCHIYTFIQSVDLQAQIDELRGLLRVSELTLKDKEFKFTKTVETYEMSLFRLKDENKQMSDKYEKYENCTI